MKTLKWGKKKYKVHRLKWKKSTKEFDNLVNFAKRDRAARCKKNGLKGDMAQGKTLFSSPRTCETERPEEFSAPRK